MFGGKSRAAGWVSAVGWAVGLVAGVIALASGYLLAAGACLILAFVAPWFGLVAVLHTKDRERRLASSRASTVF